MNKETMINEITTRINTRINSADNANKAKELTRAKKVMLSESALSFFVRRKVKNFTFVTDEAQKTLLKIAKIAQALVEKNASLLDNHTKSVLLAAMHIQDKERFFSYDEIKTMQSNQVESTASAQLDDFKRRTFAMSTLSAQTPTTIHALSVLNLCDVKEENAKRKTARFKIERKDLQFLTV